MKAIQPINNKKNDKLIDFFDIDSLLLEINNLRIIFKDTTPDWYLLDCLKYGEEPKYSFRIEVINAKSRSIQATYVKIFQRYPNYKYFDNFVTKFLREPIYRKRFEIEGEWLESIDSHSQDKYKVNIICQQQIKRLNKMKRKKLRFSHFKHLKTGGFDDFSKMNKASLEKIISKQTIEDLGNEVMKEKMLISVLRWIARGLKPQLAIRKVRTDEEIQNNARKNKIAD